MRMPLAVVRENDEKVCAWFCPLSGPQRFDKARGERGDTH